MRKLLYQEGPGSREIFVLQKWFLYTITGVLCLSLTGFSYKMVFDKALVMSTTFNFQRQRNEEKLAIFKRIQPQVVLLNNRATNLDRDLNMPFTNKMNQAFELLEQSVIFGDFDYTKVLVGQISSSIDSVIAQQNEIKEVELHSYVQQIENNLLEMDKILADQAMLPNNWRDVLANEDEGINNRLVSAKEYVEKTSNEIRRRQTEIALVKKQILVRKSSSTLTMIEDGRAVYTMKISLGRTGYETRSGDFTILDKLGDVWGVWKIWLPDWMGIYYAGSSENGIHGLPYDNSGKLYWASQVGKQNITYGCVMPNNDDMERLYKWADVGVPVAIIN